jgi:hypothetical protein
VSSSLANKRSLTQIKPALSRRRRRQAIAVAQAVFAGSAGPPPAPRLERFADDLDEHLRRSGPWTRLVIGVALWALTWLAPLWRFRPLPFTALALETRVRVLNRVEQSLLQAAFFATKAVFCLIYFEQTEGAADLGVEPTHWGALK